MTLHSAPVAYGPAGLAGAIEGEADALAAERELVRRTQQGDTTAFDGLVRRHLRQARIVAQRLMRDADDADDLVQEAFLRSLEKIATFDAARPFGPWLIRILMNAGVDAHRRRAVRAVEPASPELPSPRAAPDADAEGAELRRRLTAALAELPPRQRVIVAAFELDGQSVGEIARALGITPVTVRWHLHQGRRTLRTLLHDLHD